jgi:hypothetical protein
MQRRLSQETVDSQSWAIEILDALNWLPGRRIESVVRTAKINDPGDEVIILNRNQRQSPPSAKRGGEG